jgi:hypothetical protein
MKPLDLTGQKFGMLTAVRSTGEKLRSSYLWEFRCDCGNLVVRSGPAVKFGMIKSCGCATSAMISEARATHGLQKGEEKEQTKPYRRNIESGLVLRQGVQTRTMPRTLSMGLEVFMFVLSGWTAMRHSLTTSAHAHRTHTQLTELIQRKDMLSTTLGGQPLKSKLTTARQTG